MVEEGDVADCTHIIHSGELRAVMAGDSGRTMALNTRVAGEFFGELMRSGERRAATVAVAVAVIIRAQLMVNRLLYDPVRGGYIEKSRDGIVLLKKLPSRWQ